MSPSAVGIVHSRCQHQPGWQQNGAIATPARNEAERHAILRIQKMVFEKYRLEERVAALRKHKDELEAS